MGEFGLRMALGAKPRDLVRMILGQGMTLAVTGAGGRAGLRRRADAPAGKPAIRRGRTGSGDVRGGGAGGGGGDGARLLPARAPGGGGGSDALAAGRIGGRPSCARMHK